MYIHVHISISFQYLVSYVVVRSIAYERYGPSSGCGSRWPGLGAGYNHQRQRQSTKPKIINREDKVNKTRENTRNRNSK